MYRSYLNYEIWYLMIHSPLCINIFRYPVFSGFNKEYEKPTSVIVFVIGFDHPRGYKLRSSLEMKHFLDSGSDYNISSSSNSESVGFTTNGFAIVNCSANVQRKLCD